MNSFDISSFLKNYNLKVTPGRKEILHILQASKKPLSIQEIHEKVQDKENIDLSTLYRTIETFLKKRIIQSVSFQHQHAHYAFLKDARHHHHIVCTECEYTEELDKCLLPEIAQKVILDETKGFSKIDTHALDFFGVCKKCIGKTR